MYVYHTLYFLNTVNVCASPQGPTIPYSPAYSRLYVTLELPRGCSWERTCLPMQETYETQV